MFPLQFHKDNKCSYSDIIDDQEYMLIGDVYDANYYGLEDTKLLRKNSNGTYTELDHELHGEIEIKLSSVIDSIVRERAKHEKEIMLIAVTRAVCRLERIKAAFGSESEKIDDMQIIADYLRQCGAYTLDFAPRYNTIENSIENAIEDTNNYIDSYALEDAIVRRLMLNNYHIYDSQPIRYVNTPIITAKENEYGVIE